MIALLLKLLIAAWVIILAGAMRAVWREWRRQKAERLGIVSWTDL